RVRRAGGGDEHADRSRRAADGRAAERDCQRADGDVANDGEVGGDQERHAAGVEHQAHRRRLAGGHTMRPLTSGSNRVLQLRTWAIAIATVVSGTLALTAQAPSAPPASALPTASSLDAELTRIFRDRVYTSR